VGAHLALAAGIAVIPPQKLREVVAIALAETPKPEAAKPPPPRKAPPEANRPARALPPAAPAAVAAPATETPQTGTASFADIGIALDASAVDGLAVPMATPEKRSTAAVAFAPQKPKLLVSRRAAEDCQEPIVKPIPDVLVRPDYTEAARNARIEGRVRVEAMVDTLGGVSSARLLSNLGYGLDEAALAAVKKMRFRPGTRCAKPLPTAFVVAVRFTLGT
jgi:protein TonB